MKFNDLGSRLLSNITVRQYRVSAGKVTMFYVFCSVHFLHCNVYICPLTLFVCAGGTVERVKIGLINVNSNFLSYVVGENETTVYPSTYDDCTTMLLMVLFFNTRIYPRGSSARWSSHR